ncbi:hypothetical protein BST83_12155 [Polaribacter filamentus]|uniref:Uncharacterized protein n=1 Tax=Polaribacter filamentus TaxID=53483 RepID=A0A2S7KYX3_9FLAO|nr:glycosyl transferase [Polaribacter filamentus]PQB07821.1 hypothetical protein BST83_12155 [Polaribacter filamentus]
MWLDDDNFIFNDYDFTHEIYISRIINITTLNDRRIDYPIYDSKDNVAFGLSYKILSEVRPDYGYRCHKYTKSDYANGNIFRVDLNSGEKKDLFFLNEMQSYTDKDVDREWFNHIMISPNGKKIMFLHRWEIKKVKFDALYVADSDGSNLKCISNNGMVSHCFWIDDKTVLGYLRGSNKKDQYYYIDIQNNNHLLVSNQLSDMGDGHPSFCNKKILFDTYPNKSRMKELFVYDIVNDELDKVGEFFESLKYTGETRCDLHPRFSSDGKKIYLDSVHEGSRSLFEIYLDEKK